MAVGQLCSVQMIYKKKKKKRTHRRQNTDKACAPRAYATYTFIHHPHMM